MRKRTTGKLEKRSTDKLEKRSTGKLGKRRLDKLGRRTLKIWRTEAPGRRPDEKEQKLRSMTTGNFL